MLHVPLHRQLRYIHEPLPAGDHAIPVLGHETLVASLKERLTYSHGGAFLVSGFRGVGKSALVLRALAEASVEWGSRDVLLVAHLNVARSMTAKQRPNNCSSPSSVESSRRSTTGSCWCGCARDVQQWAYEIRSADDAGIDAGVAAQTGAPHKRQPKKLSMRRSRRAMPTSLRVS